MRPHRLTIALFACLAAQTATSGAERPPSPRKGPPPTWAQLGHVIERSNTNAAAARSHAEWLKGNPGAAAAQEKQAAEAAERAARQGRAQALHQGILQLFKTPGL